METMRESGRVSGRVASHFKAIITEGKLFPNVQHD
jgi:hypothetical protein